ncbi:hypothetical protein Acr_07g0012120 [Actinidia rufa]|uniref:Uncharacterized protein n=1 Tax=Actinidia rufa TaxID=165716 RepID=A0A7J0EXU5_9ERIC|nr:hypothetical protein Acr_07g0012120 [Actinidia rufa]
MDAGGPRVPRSWSIPALQQAACRCGGAYTLMGSGVAVDEGKVSRILSCKSYRGARSEAIKMDNLKTLDYPLVG